MLKFSPVLTFLSHYDINVYVQVCNYISCLQQKSSSVIIYGPAFQALVFLSLFQMTSRMVSIFLRCSAPVVMMYIRVVLMFEWPKMSASFATSWSML